jgi:hypothetical protein
MNHAETRRWLMRIAGAIDAWPLREQDGRSRSAHETTPTAAVATLVYRDIAAADDRRVVIAALPRVLSEDWTEAAHQIREAAQRLWPSSAEDARSARDTDAEPQIRIALPEGVWEIALDRIETSAPAARPLLARIRQKAGNLVPVRRRVVVFNLHEAQLLLTVFSAAANAHAHRGDDHRLRLAVDGGRQVIDAIRTAVPKGSPC